uniref:Uncharacterized protein n=1 Tax=Cacopsylla melanoneura TaxID=428564 RepID=A0A8D8XV88_9HEMI
MYAGVRRAVNICCSSVRNFLSIFCSNGGDMSGFSPERANVLSLLGLLQYKPQSQHFHNSKHFHLFYHVKSPTLGPVIRLATAHLTLGVTIQHVTRVTRNTTVYTTRQTGVTVCESEKSLWSQDGDGWLFNDNDFPGGNILHCCYTATEGLTV